MMTRKHFEEQAAIIQKHLPRIGGDGSYDMACDLADYFEKENPRFDRDRFFVACGLGLELCLRPLPVEWVDADNPSLSGGRDTT